MTPSNKTIKFAVVGCGHIGKRHAKMIACNLKSELTALIDVRERNVLEMDYQVPFFSSLDDFLVTGPEVDVIVIASPNGFHAEQAMKCLEARKHVVVEKPLALTTQDAEKVIFKALYAHRHVFVVMQNRFSPQLVWVKELVESGILGDIFMVQLNCYWNRDERYYIPESWHGNKELDGGPLFTQFSHFIDAMYWLFGDVRNIRGKLNNFNHRYLTDFEDSGFVSFDFVNGGMGALNYSTAVWSQNLESSMTIIAKNGSIKISGQYMNSVEICVVKDYIVSDSSIINPWNDGESSGNSAVNHQYVIKNVVDVLNGQATIATNALEGLKVVDIIERIYATLK